MTNILHKKIRENKFLTISEYMNIALFDKEFGYYINHNPLGRESDFITSPEISQIFGEIIAAFIIDFYQRKFSNQKINLVEMGAGKGVMLFDFLRFSKKFPNFYQNINIHIIEINQKLIPIQQKKLKDFNVKWWSGFNEFCQKSKSKPLFFLANELLDCFAIDQFVFKDKQWLQRIVKFDKNNKLKFDLIQTEQNLEQLIPEEFKKNITEGAFFEINKSAQNFMINLAQTIKSNNGISIIIDYGYYRNFFKDTLQGMKNHKFTNILNDIGKSDITAHVDFYPLINIALKKQLHVNFLTQRDFLLSNGAELRREILIKEKSYKVSKEINSAINRLIDKKNMGELFKFFISSSEH